MESFEAYIPGIRMNIIEININAILQSDTHSRKSLWCEAVLIGDIRASTPFDTLEIYPWVIGERIQSRTERNTSRSRRPVWMVVSFIHIGMVVEILAGRR